MYQIIRPWSSYFRKRPKTRSGMRLDEANAGETANPEIPCAVKIREWCRHFNVGTRELIQVR